MHHKYLQIIKSTRIKSNKNINSSMLKIFPFPSIKNIDALPITIVVKVADKVTKRLSTPPFYEQYEQSQL